MTPLLHVTTVFGLGAICNLFDSQHTAVTEQNILNVHICYPDTMDQGQLGSNRQYIQGCCKHIELCRCTQPNTTHSWHFQMAHFICTGNLCIVVIESRSSKGSHMVCRSSLMHLWNNRCKMEHTWNSRTEALTEQSVCNTIHAWGLAGVKSLQKQSAVAYPHLHTWSALAVGHLFFMAGYIYTRISFLWWLNKYGS